MRVLVFLLIAAVAVAQEAECDAIVAAAQAGDKATLVKHAEAEKPGAWVLAHVLCARGEYDAALAFAKAAPGPDRARLPAYIESRRGKGDDAEARRVLARVLELFAAARSKECLDAMNTLEMKEGTAIHVKLNALRPYCLAHQENLADAMDAWLAAGREAYELGDLMTAADGLEIGGNLAHRRKRFVAARESWMLWAEVEKERGHPKKEAEALFRATHTYPPLGRVAEPQLLERAIALYAQLGNRQREGEMLGKASQAYVNAGDHARALAYAQRGLKLVEESGDPAKLLASHRTVATVYARLEDFDKALAAQMRALDAAKKMDNPAAVAITELQIGQIVRTNGDLDKARAYYERSLEVLRSQRHPYATYATLVLGGLFQETEEYDKAMRYHQQALAAAERQRDMRMLVLCMAGMSDIHMVMRNYDKALPILKRWGPLAERLGQSDLILRNQWATTNCLRYLGRPQEALETVRPAVETVTRIYRGLGEEEAAQARARYARVFDLAAGAARELNDAPLSFHYLEVARAGTLLEALGGRAQLRNAAIPQELVAEETAARANVERARARYAEARRMRDFKQSKTRKRDLDKALGALRDVIQKIERESKSGAELLYPGAATLADTQAALANGEALVLYSVQGISVMAVVATADDVRVMKLGEAEALRDTCDEIALDDTEEDPGEPLAALRKQIVEPLKLGKKIKRVLVSPDGSLSYVPFCLLLDGREVVYVPSGTTYGTLRAESKKRGERILALGDPVYGKDLKPLPHTRAEAKAIGDVVLLGADATKDGLAKALGAQKRWRAIHLACHGLVDVKRPTLSSLAITGGRLSAYEIMRLDLAADLVTLSACETGKGKIVRGEGLLGLTRAFMVAGTPRVIVSLWPVEDAATSALMTHFYELWKMGTPPATALARAQAHVRANKKWTHPNYWAAWQLWGLG